MRKLENIKLLNNRIYAMQVASATGGQLKKREIGI